MATERIFLGLSSGWAADGIDAALVAITGRGQRMKVAQLACSHTPYDDPLDRVTERLIAEAQVSRDAIAAVGFSGQSPSQPFGNPAMIAQQLQLLVACGFASSDIAAGGIGGPVAAWPGWLMFHDRRLSRVVVQMGGVITLTFVPAASTPTDVVAFDTGPGTLLLDAICRGRFDCPFDTDGAIASRGEVCGELLNEMLSHEHFHTSPPKLVNPRHWSDEYLRRLDLMVDKHRCGNEDLLATCTEMLARSVSNAVGAFTERPHEVILAGGAAQNIHLAHRIRMLLSPCSTYAIEHYGFDLRAYGALCQAVLAAARIDGKVAHCPAATGARSAAVLGGLWQH